MAQSSDCALLPYRNALIRQDQSATSLPPLFQVTFLTQQLAAGRPNIGYSSGSNLTLVTRSAGSARRGKRAQPIRPFQGEFR